MTKINFYKCEECGNIVALIKDGGGELICCGDPMIKLSAKTADAAKEKHVPVVKKENGKIIVTVGSTLHPMLEEHYIEWIALESNGKLNFVFLKPGDEPKAEFEEVGSGTVFENCNVHGLWKSEV